LCQLASRTTQRRGELASGQTQLRGELASGDTQRRSRAGGGWDTSETAPARPLLLVGWVAGFVAYQLTLPTYFDGVGRGWTAWWTARQLDLGIDPSNGWSASLVSLAVAAVLTALVTVPATLRRRRPAVTP
jgi:ABC-type Fe3+ transport system permease subunit